MVRTLTKEPNPSSPVFATNALVMQYANIAQNEIAMRTKANVSSNVPNSTADPSDVTVAGQRLYAFPSDCLELLKVQVSVWVCKRISIDDYVTATGVQAWQMTGNPWAYWIEKKTTNSYGLFYTPQAIYPIALWYIRKPTAMATGSDSPDLPRFLDMAIVYWVCEKVMEARREMGYKSGYWQRKYEEEIIRYNTTADQSMEPIQFLGQVPVSSD